MKTPQKLPLGIQNFEKLRNGNCLYIDKTQFIWNLSQLPSAYFLSRPRRFGKSLLLSTMKSYFLGKREFFDGLAIQELEDATENSWQEYPVFHLDFNAEKYTEKEDLDSALHYRLFNFEKIYGSNKDEKTFSKRFLGLLKRAYEKTGKQVVILIDEYDKPLLQTLNNKELNEYYRAVLKGFYGVIKSADEYIRFTFLTGVTRFSKISIFSDLNNLTDISLRKDYAGICGITQKELEENFKNEIKILANENSITFNEVLKTLKQKYDGYQFAKQGEKVYNPFSLLHSLSAREFEYYWFATGTPTFLIKYLKEGHQNIPDLDGNIILNEAGLSNYRADDRDPLPILFQSGYLTIKNYIPNSGMYILGFPNDEVRYAFLDNLLPEYVYLKTTESALSIWRFAEDIKANRVDEFMERIQAIISGIPYDNFTEEEIKLREQNYQTAVYLIFALMGQFVQTEVHCATGRADCIVETETKIYIFEFKIFSSGTPQDAIAQIKEKNYASKYKACDKEIILIGASFDEAKKTIGKWDVSL